MTPFLLRYLCEEIERQKDRPICVADLAAAWDRAALERDAGLPLTVDRIQEWGRLAKPDMNAQGFRTRTVWIGDDEGAPPYLIRTRLLDLCDRVKRREWDAAKAYYHFEKIHPFADGNGRTGKILYNYILDTMDMPTLPPDFFGGVI